MFKLEGPNTPDTDVGKCFILKECLRFSEMGLDRVQTSINTVDGNIIVRSIERDVY